MILTRDIDIKISESNYQYYDDLGYDVAILFVFLFRQVGNSL